MPDSRVSAVVTPSCAATSLGVDEVDRHAGAAGEHPAEHAGGEQAGVEVGHAAAVRDLDGVDRLAGELHEQPAEPRAEVHVGHELVGVVAGGRGTLTAPRSNRPRKTAATCSATDTPARRRASSVDASAAHVSSRCGAARTAADGGVPASTATAAPAMVPAASASASASRSTAPGEQGLTTRRPRLSCTSSAAPNSIASGGVWTTSTSALRHDQLRRDALDRADGVGAGLRFAGEHDHAQRAGALDEQRRARAHADDPQRLAAHLDAVARPACGVAKAQRGVRAGQVAGAGQHERERVLGLGDERAVGRVDDDDAAPGGFGDVDLADVHADSADHLEPSAGRQNGGRHGRTGAGDDRAATGDADAAAPPRPIRRRSRRPALHRRGARRPQGRDRRGRSLSSSRSCHGLSRRGAGPSGPGEQGIVPKPDGMAPRRSGGTRVQG